MVLFDRADGETGSTVELSTHLGLPVVLVVDVGAQVGPVAAVLRGFVSPSRRSREGMCQTGRLRAAWPAGRVTCGTAFANVVEDDTNYCVTDNSSGTRVDPKDAHPAIVRPQKGITGQTAVRSEMPSWQNVSIKVVLGLGQNLSYKSAASICVITRWYNLWRGREILKGP